MTSNNHNNGFVSESRETDPLTSDKFAGDCSPRWYLNCNFIKESESEKSSQVTHNS